MRKNQLIQMKSVQWFTKILMITVTICVILGSIGFIITFVDFKFSAKKMNNKVLEFTAVSPNVDSVHVVIKFDEYSYEDYWSNLFGWGGSISCDYTLKIFSKNIFRLDQDTEIKLLILDNDNIEIANDKIHSYNISRLVDSQGSITGYLCAGNMLYAPINFFNTALNVFVAHNLRPVE